MSSKLANKQATPRPVRCASTWKLCMRVEGVPAGALCFDVEIVHACGGSAGSCALTPESASLPSVKYFVERVSKKNTRQRLLCRVSKNTRQRPSLPSVVFDTRQRRLFAECILLTLGKDLLCRVSKNKHSAKKILNRILKS